MSEFFQKSAKSPNTIYPLRLASNTTSFFCFLFVLRCSQLTTLWQFRRNSKGTQPYLHMCLFPKPLPSGCHITLSRLHEITLANSWIVMSLITLKVLAKTFDHVNFVCSAGVIWKIQALQNNVCIISMN